MKVVDASALAAVIFEEGEAERVALRLQGASLVAPSLLRYEITNVCLTKCRRHPADRHDLMRRLERGLRFPIAERRADSQAVLLWRWRPNFQFTTRAISGLHDTSMPNSSRST